MRKKLINIINNNNNNNKLMVIDTQTCVSSSMNSNGWPKVLVLWQVW